MIRTPVFLLRKSLFNHGEHGGHGEKPEFLAC